MAIKDTAEMLRALRDFGDAYDRLDKAWVDEDSTQTNGVMLNDTKAIRLYPFAQDFDALNVREWITATIEELDNTEEYLILNTECAKCGACRNVTHDILGKPLPAPKVVCVAGLSGVCQSMYVEFDQDAVYAILKEFETDLMTDNGCEDTVVYGFVGISDMTNVELLSHYEDYVANEVFGAVQLNKERFLASVKLRGWEYYDQLGGSCTACEKVFGDVIVQLGNGFITGSSHSIFDEEYAAESERWSLDTYDSLTGQALVELFDFEIASEILYMALAYESFNGNY